MKVNQSPLAQANEAFRKKDYDNALRLYLAAQKLYPELKAIIDKNIENTRKHIAKATPKHSDTSKTSIDIVVPVFNALDDVKKCLASLSESTDGFKVNIIVVNDGSDEPTTQWLRDFCKNKSLFTIIENTKNLGYTKTVNAGLKASTADYVITQNSDTIVSKDWLVGLVNCINSDPKIGICGPLSNAASWQNVPNLYDETRKFAVNDLPHDFTIAQMAQVVKDASLKTYPQLPFVNGFCLMIKREVINKVGYMDEENFPIGYGEENDYCIRAQDAGYKLAIADDVYVYHAKSKSFGHEKRQQLSADGTAKLKEKHGVEKYADLVNKVKITDQLDKIRASIRKHLINNQSNILIKDKEISATDKQLFHVMSVEDPVSIIVPIFNAPDDLTVCIERLIKYTQPNVDIILINDASTDLRVNEILKGITQNNFRVFQNPKNLGFTKTVNRGIKLAGQNDVVFLNSDARVTPRWLEGLKNALSTDTRIATVTPMSDRAGAFSAPNIGNENDLPTGIDEAVFAKAFRRHSLGYYPTVPTGNGFCMYVRRKCINEIGLLDEQAFPRGYGEENDFCMRAREKGWRNIIDDRTYVFHDRNKSFAGEKNNLITCGRKIVDERYPDYKKATAIFSESKIIKQARSNALLALEDCLLMKPRVLFVVATQTGGTPQTNRDLMLALSDRVEAWLLHCDSKVISLSKINQQEPDNLIYKYSLNEEVEPLTHLSSEYDRVVRNWLFEFDFDVIHIRHLAWHSLNLPKLAKSTGAKVIFSFHDYYAVCPTIKLLDDNNIFCRGKCTSSSGDCKPELWKKDAFPPLKDKWVYKWRSKMESALANCDEYITTHESAKKIISENLNLNNKPFHVIPHGRDFTEFKQLAKPIIANQKIKILIPGNISIPKGGEVIQELIELDNGKHFEFHILGKTNIKKIHPSLIFHGEYKRDEFAKRCELVGAHVGGVFSIWNETWCHTLTELWSVGLPVIVFDFETLSARIETTGAGWVVQYANSKLIYKNLIKILSNTEEFKIKIENTIKWQSTDGRAESSKIMSNNYFSAYKVS